MIFLELEYWYAFCPCYLLCVFQLSREHGGIMRFIQVSCLGASSSSPSRMLRVKAAAEDAISKEFPEVKFYLELFLALFPCKSNGKIVLMRS